MQYYKNLKNQLFTDNDKLKHFSGKPSLLENNIYLSSFYYIYDMKNNIYLSKKVIKDNNLTYTTNEHYNLVTGEKVNLSILKNIVNPIYINCPIHNSNNLLIIMTNEQWKDLNNLNENKDYLLIHNIYRNIVLNKYNSVSFDELDKQTAYLTDSDRQIHWVWFRKKGFRLHNKIMKRASSWIYLNDNFTYNLWTDIENEEELHDFICELDEKYKELLLNKVNIIFKNETVEFIKKFILDYEIDLNDLDKDKFLGLFETNTRNNILFKTDILRNMIIFQNGGIYADFNDTVCLYPMKYLLPEYKNSFFVGINTQNEIDHGNNYFMYCSKGNNQFKKYTMKILNIFKYVYDGLLSKDIYNFYKNIGIGLLTKLITTSQLKIEDILSSDIFDLDDLLKELKNRENNPFYDQIVMGNDRCKINPFLIFLEKFNEKYPEYKLDTVIISIKNLLDCYNIKFNFKNFKAKRNKRRVINNLQTIYYENTHNLEEIVDKFEKMCLDENFINYYHYCFTTTMLDSAMIYTNIICMIKFFYDEEFHSINKIPFCYLPLCMNYISMMGHIGDSTSSGKDKNYDDYSVF